MWRVQAIFATELLPRERHYAPDTPLRLGVDAAFGPWTVRCDAVDAVDASGRRRLEAPPLDVWDVVRGDFEYHLPLLDVDEAAAAAGASAAPPPGAAWLGLRTAIAPHMPPVRDMESELRAALPLVVCGCGDDDPEIYDAPAAGGAEEAGGAGDTRHPGDADAAASGAATFAVRRWSAAALAAPRCVRVRTTYTRPPRARHDAGDAAAGDHPAGDGS